MTLQVALLVRCDPARFVRVEASLLARGHPAPILVIADFASPALLLGRHQRAASVVDLAAARSLDLAPLRRAGGGRALLVGDGTVGLFLYTPPGAALATAPFPPKRTTNRHVRGLLAALRSLGARLAAWFGRDFVSAGGQPNRGLNQSVRITMPCVIRREPWVGSLTPTPEPSASSVRPREV